MTRRAYYVVEAGPDGGPPALRQIPWGIFILRGALAKAGAMDQRLVAVDVTPRPATFGDLLPIKKGSDVTKSMLDLLDKPDCDACGGMMVAYTEAGRRVWRCLTCGHEMERKK